MRDHYPMTTIDDILCKLSNAKVFSTVDATNAFWHLKLDEESKNLTAFETPFGKYKWLRLAFGLKPAPELFSRKLKEALINLNGIKCIADEILIYGCGATEAEAQIDHNRNLIALFNGCRSMNLKLNKDKMRLNRTSVPFMGHVLTKQGIKSASEKVQANACPRR